MRCLSLLNRALAGQNYALILEIVDYVPLGRSSCIELPKDIHDSKSGINIENEDQECFKWEETHQR